MWLTVSPPCWEHSDAVLHRNLALLMNLNGLLMTSSRCTGHHTRSHTYAPTHTHTHTHTCWGKHHRQNSLLTTPSPSITVSPQQHDTITITTNNTVFNCVTITSTDVVTIVNNNTIHCSVNRHDYYSNQHYHHSNRQHHPLLSHHNLRCGHHSNHNPISITTNNIQYCHHNNHIHDYYSSQQHYPLLCHHNHNTITAVSP